MTSNGTTQFTTNGFVGNPMSVIAMATLSGMMFMSVGIMVGLPPLLGMVLLFGGILLVYGYKVGKVQYTIKSDGIHMRIRRFIPYWLKKKEKEKVIRWDNIKSYRNDMDWSRRFKEYEFIKLYLNVSPRQIWITDQRDKTGFQKFRDAFLKELGHADTEPGVAEVKPKRKENEVVQDESMFKTSKPAPHSHIKRRKSFYKTFFAQVLTIIFIATTVGIWIYGEQNGQKLTHFIRLRYVLVPGTVYMVFRVFVKAD